MIQTTSITNHLECPLCRSKDLQIPQKTKAPDFAIASEAVSCNGCGARYASIWGVPYLGILHTEDIKTLIETISNSNRFRSFKAEEISFNGVLAALEEYALASDKDSVLKRHGFYPKPYWWETRYQEHIEFQTLIRGLDFQGKSVLDVGAGYGSDSLRYALKGAKVTALEFGVSMFAPARQVYPQFDWVGGAAHALPFASESFDFVVAHHSLHHHTSQTQSILEMLRVLKPGGTLITIGDPFKPNHETEYDECLIFNDHPGVLGGINEQVPGFGSYATPLERFLAQLDGQIFWRQNNTDFPQVLPLREALRRLPATYGSLSMLLKKHGSLSITAPKLDPRGVLDPALFASDLMESDEKAYARLATLIEKRFLNLELLSEAFPKFRLVNGWKLVHPGDRQRTVYKRGRLYFSRDRLNHPYLRVELLFPYVSGQAFADFDVRINHQSIFTCKLLRGTWQEVLVPLSGLPPSVGEAFLLDLGLDMPADGGDLSSFTANPASLFSMRALEFGNGRSQLSNVPLENRIENAGLETLIEVWSQSETNPTVACSVDFQFSLGVLQQLTARFSKIKILVPFTQEAFYAGLPKIEVIGSYVSPVLPADSPSREMPQTRVHLILERDRDRLKDLWAKLLPLNPMNRVTYVIGAHGSIETATHAARETPWLEKFRSRARHIRFVQIVWRFLKPRYFQLRNHFAR